MSRFTTQVREICEVNAGLTESVGASKVDEIIAKAIPKVFNFDFPIFDEEYRTVLEHKILKHYYTREIGAETVGLWQLWLNTKLNEIMPYYNKLYESELLEFNPLYTHHLTRKGDKNGTENGTETGTEIGKTKGKTENKNDVNNSSWDLYSDTPQGALKGLDDNTYLTNARKNTDSGSSSGSGSNEIDVNTSLSNKKDKTTTEGYVEEVAGYLGISGSRLLQEFRSTFLNIDMLIIDELEELFMQLW